MTIVDLNQELDSALGEVDDEVDDNIYLKLGAEQFACRTVGLTWEMMKFAKAQRVAQLKAPHPAVDGEGEPHTCKACKAVEDKKNAAGTDAMIGLHSMITKVLKPEERDRFNDFMDDAELEPNELESALGEVVSELGKERDTDEGKALGKR